MRFSIIAIATFATGLAQASNRRSVNLVALMNVEPLANAFEHVVEESTGPLYEVELTQFGADGAQEVLEGPPRTVQQEMNRIALKLAVEAEDDAISTTESNPAFSLPGQIEESVDLTSLASNTIVDRTTLADMAHYVQSPVERQAVKELWPFMSDEDKYSLRDAFARRDKGYKQAMEEWLVASPLANLDMTTPKHNKVLIGAITAIVGAAGVGTIMGTQL